MATGVFVSFDGIDGAGKSTQIELLEKRFQSQGRDTKIFRDPGGTALGEALREILLHRKEIPLCMTSEMLIYMASRAQLVRQEIQPHLESGGVVISDRYLLANIVYQGHAGGLSVEDIRSVGQIATGGLDPVRTFVLDLPADEAAKRLSGERDRLESRGLDFMQRVRDGFLAEAEHLSGSVVIDASGTVEEIHQAVIKPLRDAGLL
ncbi:MAG: dTMP kinase [Aureliella sp.]